MADVLIERETVDKDELEALLENRWDEFLQPAGAEGAGLRRRRARRGRGEAKRERKPRTEPGTTLRPVTE